jgi:Dolichyl-phosphate-mannose-protein mannosyltransferase
MRPFFTPERFGRPQILAGMLLFCFLAQTLWLVRMDLSVPISGPRYYGPAEMRMVDGWRQWHGQGIAGAPYLSDRSADFNEVSNDGYDTEHSPLLSIVTAAPLLAWPQSLSNTRFSSFAGWLPRLPFLACGLLMGASLWYVARRLCGNKGGFIALTLYCFSPSFIQASAVWHAEPEIVAAWGAFGAIFTAIAVAHTLYAPREVVLWNWRRIVLLGVSLAIAVGSQFSLIVLVPMALGFLLYVAPVRRQAGLVIWIAACVVGFGLLFAMYFFHAHAFAESMRRATFWGVSWRGFTVPGVYREVAAHIGRACPALALGLPVAVVTYAAWPRTRYFGNTAPLLVAVLFVLLGVAHPHVAGAGFLLAAGPFLFIFVSGVLADLLETSYRPFVKACIVGMLGAYVLWSVVNLAQVQQG